MYLEYHQDVLTLQPTLHLHSLLKPFESADPPERKKQKTLYEYKQSLLSVETWALISASWKYAYHWLTFLLV